MLSWLQLKVIAQACANARGLPVRTRADGCAGGHVHRRQAARAPGGAAVPHPPLLPGGRRDRVGRQRPLNHRPGARPAAGRRVRCGTRAHPSCWHAGGTRVRARSRSLRACRPASGTLMELGCSSSRTMMLTWASGRCAACGRHTMSYTQSVPCAGMSCASYACASIIMHA